MSYERDALARRVLLARDVAWRMMKRIHIGAWSITPEALVNRGTRMSEKDATLNILDHMEMGAAKLGQVKIGKVPFLCRNCQ